MPAAPTRRRRWPRVTAAVLALLLLGGAVTAGVLWLVAANDDEAAVVQVRNNLEGVDDLPAGLRRQPTTRWTFPAGGALPQFVKLSGGDVYVVADRDGVLEALRLRGSDGSVVWRSSLEQGRVQSVDVAGTTMLVAITGQDHAVIRALAAADGTEQWTTELPNGDVHASLTHDGRFSVVIYEDSQTGAQVAGLDATGEELWSSSVEALAFEGNAVLVRSGGSLALVDVPTGELRWRVPVDEQAEVSLVGDRTFLASRQEVIALDASGTEVWKQSLPADDPVTVMHQGDGLVVVVRASGLVALAAADGELRWEAPPGGLVGDTGSTALTLRGTEDDFTMRVIDGDTGNPRATRILEPPAGVAMAADVVYVGDGEGVTAYDRVSLAPLWSAVVASDGRGMVVAAADDGVLVRDGEGALILLR